MCQKHFGAHVSRKSNHIHLDGTISAGRDEKRGGEMGFCTPALICHMFTLSWMEIKVRMIFVPKQINL